MRLSTRSKGARKTKLSWLDIPPKGGGSDSRQLRNAIFFLKEAGRFEMNNCIKIIFKVR